MSSRRWTIALCAWTAVVWTTRIGNIWNDAALTEGEKWGRTALALSFTALLVAVLVTLRADLAVRRVLVLALAGWTTVVWVVRAAGIATGDHDAAFVAVHLVLAVVSIGLAALAVLGLDRDQHGTKIGASSP